MWTKSMRGLKGGSNNRAGIQEPAPRTVERQSREDARPIGPGVDADAVPALFHLRTDGVTVNHNKSMVGMVGQERLPDPAHVLLPLLVQCQPRPDSGVDEEIIAEPARIDEGP